MIDSPVQRVAAEVRAEMARQRRSQADLAMRLNLSQAAVSRRLTGEVAFDVGEISVVSEFLGVAVDRLLAGDAA